MEYYEILREDALKLPIIQCVGYGDVDCAYGPTIRDQYIIHYVLSGKGTFNGMPVKEGQGFIIYPGVMNEYHYDEDAPWSYLWFKSYDKDIVPFFEMHGAENGIFSYSNKEEIMTVVDVIRMSNRRTFTSTQLTEFFAHIFNECIKSKSSGNTQNSRKYCDWCQKYIDVNIDKPITVGMLCELLGITQPYLFKIFKSELGVSPKQYIVRRKINQAKTMLAETDVPISTVATSLGFYDTISFSKFFKSVTGSSPSLFRQTK